MKSCLFLVLSVACGSRLRAPVDAKLQPDEQQGCLLTDAPKGTFDSALALVLPDAKESAKFVAEAEKSEDASKDPSPADKKEWKKAMESFLNSEAQYRLRLEQAKEAEDGAKFAEEEYEKWRTAHKAAKKALEDGIAKKAEELEGLKNEEKMIRKIMRYIGVLHDVKATERSIAAGGRDSVKDKRTGVSNPYESDQTQPSASTKAMRTSQLVSIQQTKEELEDTVNQLAALMTKSKVPGAANKVALLAQKASMNKLAVYDETVEVVKILKELLADIVTRREVLMKGDDSDKKLVDDAMNKMVEWETKLVALGNAKDKASAKAAAGADEREKLNGEQVVAENKKDEVGDAAKTEIPPFDREIFVITMIKKKVNQFCETGKM